MTIRSVPIIDIAAFLSGTLEDKRRVAAEVGRACEEIGFLIVKGHGVPRELVTQMYEVSKRFFDLPLDEKMETHGRERSRGYGPLGEEALSYGLGKAAPADVKEGLYEGPMAPQQANLIYALDDAGGVWFYRDTKKKWVRVPDDRE